MSEVLFGSTDKTPAKNIVRFECHFKYGDFMDVYPVGNKATQGWKITDFNNVLNENPFFPSTV